MMTRKVSSECWTKICFPNKMASCKFFLNFHTMISLVTALNCTLLQGSILVGWATRTLGSSPRRSSPSSRRPSSTTRRTWSSWSRYRQDINYCLFFSKFWIRIRNIEYVEMSKSSKEHLSIRRGSF